MKRTPLRRKTQLRRISQREKTTKRPDTFQYSQSKTDGNGNNFGRNVKEAVRKRQFDVCAMCTAPMFAFHHRRLRSQGGPGSLENCLGLCLNHHILVHNRVDWSYRHGLLVRSSRNPRDIVGFLLCPVDCEINHVDY